MLRKNRKIIIAVLATVFIVLGLLWFLGGQVKKNNPPAVYTSTASENLEGLTFSDFYKQIKTGGATIEKLIAGGAATKDPNATVVELDPKTLTDQYSAKDLKVVANTGANIQSYGLDLVKTLQLFANKRPNEAVLMLTIIDSENLNDLAKLEQSANMHEQTASRLAKLSVPNGAVADHLELLNTMTVLGKLISNMALVLDQPVLALESATEYQKQSIQFFNSINKLNTYFLDNKVLFDDAEGVKIYVNLED